MLYFAYGSNLDELNWEDWCRDKGFDAASIEPIGRAWLPDYELAFHYRSRLRRGGALDIRRKRGTATPGALFRVHDWQGLDAKEGVSGGYYRRLRVTALTDDGHAHSATTYTVCEDRVGRFVSPGPEYREMVLRGLSRFGHAHDGFLAVAEGASPLAFPTALFTYGTLMRGEQRHDLLKRSLRRVHGEAHVTGASLIQIDWYPGLVLGSDGQVHGELYEVENVSAVLDELDRYEDFLGYEREDSLYRRSLVMARTATGPTLAWTYIYLGDPEAFPLIPTGRWAQP